MNREFISELEELVLLSVGILHPEAYAYSIKRELKIQVSKSLSLASVHTVLYRLENRGYLKSEMGGQSEKRGGRSKRLFSLTHAGKAIVKDIRVVRQAMWSRLELGEI